MSQTILSMPPITHEAEATPQRVHKHRILNRAQLLIYKLLFAHLGKFIVAAVYFIILQLLHGQHTTIGHSEIVFPDVKGVWDTLLSRSTAQGGFIRLMNQASWNGLRHVVFRGLMEGVLGMVLFKQMGFNVIKYKAKLATKKQGAIDNLILKTKVFASPYQDHPVTALQYCFLPVMLFAITAFIGVPLYLVVNHFAIVWHAHFLTSTGVQHTIIQKLYTGSEVYEGLIIGLVVGIIAGFTYRAYLYANTTNYGSVWVWGGHKAHWWMPKPTRDYIRTLWANLAHGKAPQVHVHTGFLAAMATIGLSLSVFGYFVISTNGFGV